MADSATYTPETLQRRYAMAQALLADPKKPITHWAEGLNELAKGALGGYQMRNTERLEAKQRGDANAQVMAALGLGGPSASAPLPAGPPSAGPTPAAPTGGPAPQVLGAGGAPATPDAQGVYGADATMMPPPGGPAMAGGGPNAPRGIRNNNALNLEASPFTQGQPGFSGSDGRFGKFDTPENGLAAADKLLASYGARGINTIPGIINRWAPQSDGNNTANYAAFVAKQAGLDPAAPVDLSDPAVRAKIIPAMAQFENGKGATGGIGAIAAALNGGPSGAPTAAQAASAGAPPSPAVADVAKTLSAPAGAPAAPLAGPAGVGANPNAKAIAAVLTSPWIDPSVKQAVIAQSSPSFGFQTLPDGTIVRTNPKTGQVEPIYQTPSKPQFVPNVSPNQYGVAQPGFVDPLNKKAFDISGNPITASPQATQNANPDVTGEDFLKTMPKAQADQIKGITEGRISPPGAFALKTPYWQKMLTDVAQYEPGFDLTKWGGRSATAKDFASGKSAQNITSFNTAISHLDTLDKAAEGLNNYSLTPINTIKNLVASKTGDPAIKNFDVAKNAVTDELTRAFRGSGGSVHDVKQWEDAINSANSPAQLKAAIKQATELLRGRIESLGDTYNRGMNTKTEAVQLLSPKAQKSLARLSGEGQPEPAPPAAAAGPAPKLGEEKEFKQGVGVWDGTKWVPKPTGGPSA